MALGLALALLHLHRHTGLDFDFVGFVGVPQGAICLSVLGLFLQMPDFQFDVFHHEFCLLFVKEGGYDFGGNLFYIFQNLFIF